MVIAHNISALNTYKSLGIAGGQADNSMEKLSSGYKINKAADDAAGLSISEKMRSQIRGLNQASTNAENGVSMIQTAEGALNEQHSILQRMRELAVQSATDTNAQEDREALQSEMAQLTSEINRIGSTTQFNGMNILNGDKGHKVEGGKAAEYTVNLTAAATKNVEKADVDALIKKYSEDYNIAGVTFTDSDGESAGTAVLKLSSKSILTKAADVTSANAEATVAGSTAKALQDEISITGVTDAVTVTRNAVIGTASDNSVYFHVGANSNQVINTEFNDMRAASLGITKNGEAAGDVNALANLDATQKLNWSATPNVNNGTETTNVEYSLNITSREGANNAIDVIDAAIKKVSDERSKYGAIQNRLEYTINNLNTTAENMTAAESTIRDVDMADEMMEYTKNNILQQAAQAMLVQANARPQQALQLLQ
ncbi:MAG: flagellin [Clostridia bacterium]|nr:flagellin [Clostridia bacterium]